MIEQIKYIIFSGALYKDLVKELHENSFDENKVIQLLKNKKLDINAVDRTGKTLLFDLVKKRKIEAIRFLFKNGLNINAEDNYGKTVLNEAINFDDGVMIRFLIEQGSNINYVNKSKRTVMQDVALEGNIKVFKFLMLKNPNLRHKDEYSKNVLFDAIGGGNLEIVKEIIHNFTQEELNSVDIGGKSALFYAVLKANKEIIKLLISYEIDINILDLNGQNALFNALILGEQNIEIIEMLIQKGINLKQENEDGLTILDEILKILYLCKYPIDNKTSQYRLVNASRNYLKLAPLLLEYDFKINKINKDGRTILHQEILKKDYDTIEFLITAGADVNVIDSDGRTILFDVIIDGLDSLDMIAYLLKKGADIVHRDNEERTIIDDLVEIILIQQNGKQPRHKRFIDLKDGESYFELLRNLFAFDPKINRPKNNGQTIIFELLNYNNIELLKLFINNNIDLNVVDGNKQTPFSTFVNRGMALEKGGKERVKFLETLGFVLKYRLNIDSTYENKRTILHLAIIADDAEVVEKLLSSKNIDIKIKDAQGRTALHHTQWSGNVKIARLLIAKGANIDEPDSAGYTILNYASILGKVKLVQFLISHGVLMYNKNLKSKTVTQFFLKNEGNLYKLLQEDVTNEKMRKDLLEVIRNLKNEIRLV